MDDMQQIYAKRLSKASTNNKKVYIFMKPTMRTILQNIDISDFVPDANSEEPNLGTAFN